VVLAEVFSGINPQGEAAGVSFLDSLEFLLTSREAARQAGVWRYLYARRGVSLPVTDMLIAATAIEHDATLVTSNLRHYSMPELSLLTLPR
jgi:predicted nucleic acid-binding protein